MKEKLILLLADPRNIGRLCELLGEMPNVDTSTWGGKVFWKEVASCNGWRIQQNKFTHHCRILDPSDTRRSWGSESAMKKALARLR